MEGIIRQFPHCDSRILHSPGECQFCDMHPEWQELRKYWGIAFTGQEPSAESKTGKQLPCPADFNRGDKHKLWGGNRAYPVGTDPLGYASEMMIIVSEDSGLPPGVTPSTSDLYPDSPSEDDGEND